MKALLLAAVLSASPVLAADVGVSISIGQPGFYGRIDIGKAYPSPVLVYPQPIVIGRVPAGRPPIYLNVPPGHAKHWSRHCHEYNACGERVYFVRNDWYEREYVPRYQREHGSRDIRDDRFRDRDRRGPHHDERDRENREDRREMRDERHRERDERHRERDERHEDRGR